MKSKVSASPPGQLEYLSHSHLKGSLLFPSGEISCFKDEIETELERSRPKLRGIYAAYTKEMGQYLLPVTKLFVSVVL